MEAVVTRPLAFLAGHPHAHRSSADPHRRKFLGKIFPVENDVHRRVPLASTLRLRGADPHCLLGLRSNSTSGDFSSASGAFPDGKEESRSDKDLRAIRFRPEFSRPKRSLRIISKISSRCSSVACRWPMPSNR